VTQLTATLTGMPRFAAAAPQPLPLARPGRTPTISLEAADSPSRADLEACIAETFARHYDARIEHFLPFLLSLQLSSEPGAVAGLRPAAHSPLFLEQYLEGPVEQAVAGAFGTPVERAGIIEVGNLASVTPGSAALLFGLLPILLHEAGIRWVVCTATPQVQSMLDRLDFSTRRICAADAEVLGDSKADWGSYYDSRPEVIAGDVEGAIACALRKRSVARLALALAEPISRIAAGLRSSR
jgi:hypothetical protein